MSPTTKTEAFATYGAKLTNLQWSWSARAANAVVLTLWADKFDWKSKPVSYDGTHEPGDLGMPGNRERLEHLLWARDHCDRRVRVVMARRAAVTGERRKIEDIFARPDLKFRLTELDEKTGEFRAVRVVTP